MIFLAFIITDDVSFHYSGRESLIKNLNLQFNKGEFSAIMGPNGCGKTTLGKLMIGILKPVSGSVLIDQKDTVSMSLGEAGKKVGYLFQNPEFQIFATTVLEELSFILRLKGVDGNRINREVDRILDLLNLKDKRDSITFGLSYGEKQRLAIAGILLNRPDYLILDEPTTGLDIVRKEILLEILNELLDEGIGMSVITHDKKFVDNFSGRLLNISEGEVHETSIS